MKVEIRIYDYNEYNILKKLTSELKTKKPTSIKKDAFGIDLELTVNSFDEIIYLLEKYNSEIEIELSIYSINEVRVYIDRRESSFAGLGNQVE